MPPKGGITLPSLLHSEWRSQSAKVPSWNWTTPYSHIGSSLIQFVVSPAGVDPTVAWRLDNQRTYSTCGLKSPHSATVFSDLSEAKDPFAAGNLDVTGCEVFLLGYATLTPAADCQPEFLVNAGRTPLGPTADLFLLVGPGFLEISPRPTTKPA